MGVDPQVRSERAGLVRVDAHAPVAFTLAFVPGLHGPAGRAALLRACRDAATALVVSGPEPAGAERRLWAAFGAARDAGAPLTPARVLIPRGERDFAAVHTVVQAAVAAGLARRDVLVTAGDRHTVQATVLAAAILRRHTAAVRIVHDWAGLADVLDDGWRARLGAEPVALPLLQATALVDVDRLVRADPPDAVQGAAIRALAARIPALANPARRLLDTAAHQAAAEHSRTLLSGELVDAVHRAWRDAVPVLGRAPAGAGSPDTVHDLRPMSFPVLVGQGVLDPERSRLAEHLPPGARVLAVVDGYSASTTAAAANLLAGYRRTGRIGEHQVHVMSADPAEKTAAAARRVVALAHGLALGPHDRILAIGGGTVMDTVGFAAALYHGATPYVRIPTTLVGLVDAGVGFKVGVDVGVRRNLIGAYFPPAACLCDTRFLATLPAAELRCGLAEMIKIAAVRDAGLFQLLEQDADQVLAGSPGPAVTRLVQRSIEAMTTDLAANPCEADLRRLPDFGHEFGHLLESASGMRLRHGEAVAVGMALSCRLAAATGRLADADCERILDLLLRLGLPVYDRSCDPARLWEGLLRDVVPHKGGRLHLVVPTAIGSGGYIDELSALDPALLAREVEQLRRRAARTSTATAAAAGRRRRVRGLP